MPPIGFVILSHKDPPQLLRLTRRLLRSFPGTTIACHHDFVRCPMPVVPFSRNVLFVQPSLVTFWGHISLVQAELHALRLLYETVSPDWFVMLSGSDYLVTSGTKLTDELANSRYDVYMDYREITAARAKYVVRPAIYTDPDWNLIAHYRYIATELSPDVCHRLSNASTNELYEIDRFIGENRANLLILSERSLPLHVQCFAGDHWIIGNRRVAERLLDQGSIRDLALDYFKDRVVPDEAVYQTILCNMRDIKISRSNRRYSDWSGNFDHPKILGPSDLSKILNSDAFFARKFLNGDVVLDFLDKICDGLVWTPDLGP
jgi:hypothetical protein